MALSRSEQMSRIRGTNTKPEVALRDALSARRFVHDPDVAVPAGRPDVVLSDARVVVFIDGCFWHGCPLHYARPRSREEFWSTKLVTNLERDARISAALTKAGWCVVRLWEHEVIENLDGAVEQVCAVASRGQAAPKGWQVQRRLRRVVEIAGRMERREVVRLSDPAVVIEATDGPRITAKARVKRT